MVLQEGWSLDRILFTWKCIGMGFTKADHKTVREGWSLLRVVYHKGFHRTTGSFHQSPSIGHFKEL